MSEAERLFMNYEMMQKEVKLLRHQLENFVGITEDEMIDTMVFGGQSDEPRVTMTKRHDRTETIALSFREKTVAANRELYQFLSDRYLKLTQDLAFFETAIKQLPEDLSTFVVDLVVKGESWDNLMVKYHISRSSITRWKKRAIKELDVIYQLKEQQLVDYLLS
ncbi:helix-turn-helix domain-containing protein [Streptococcus fryi]